MELNRKEGNILIATDQINLFYVISTNQFWKQI